MMSINAHFRRAASILSNLARRQRSRRAAEAQLVRASGLFDDEWYCLEYPDVQAAGVDPLRHFMSVGWLEGRDPGPEFSSQAYLRANADVARAGTNPLVHFIEFGQSEGRETFGHRPAIGQSPIRRFDFPEPALCFSASPPAVLTTAWLGHEELSGQSDLFFIGDEPAGIANAETVTSLQSALAFFSALSGDEEHSSKPDDWAVLGGEEILIDAWFVNTMRLRTRWAVDRHAFVIRAYQTDPLERGAVRRVAEGLVSSPLDLIDLRLANAYFPVLLVFAEPRGTITGVRLLAFPSLCRGGSNYPELLDAGAAEIGNLNPLAHGEVMARRMANLLSGRNRPAATDLSVNLAGADGTGPLFQPDFQAWLGRVARIAVMPRGEGGIAAPPSYLAAAVTVEPRSGRSGGGRSLVLQYGMIPTIALLAEPLSQGSPGLLPLLIAGAEPAQPALSIALPEDVNSIIPSHLGYGMSEWPRLHGGERGSRRTAYPAGAIKAGRGKPLTDAELFFPISPEAGPLDTGYRPAVTWFVHCHGDDDRLIETLESASLQCGAIGDRLSLVGRPTARVLACAACGFGDRVDCYRDLDSAIRALDTMLCGFIAADVILHDNRCASFLAALLELDQVASASCVLIAVEARGTAWHATVGDGGELTGRNGELLGRQAGVRVAAELWRSVYPVAGRSQNLWLAKSAGLIAQTSDEGEPAGLHLCSAVVTASLMETPGRAAVRAVRPGMVRDQATHAAVLFG